MSAAIIFVIGIGIYLTYQSENEGMPRTIRYSYTVHNPKTELLKDVGFYVYLPVSNSSYFTPGQINSTHDYQVKTDALGNRIMAFQFDEFPPLSTEIVSVTTQVNILQEPTEQDVNDLQNYLKAEKYVELQSAELRTLGARLGKDNKKDTANRIFDWVSRNIKYQGYVSKDKGALQAYKTRQGDCTEYMYLFTALARIDGIPVRNVGGFVVKENSLLKSEDFHNWSEVYLDGKWRVVDPQNRQFLRNESEYIGMRIIADSPSDSQTPFNSHRFFITNNSLQVKMN